MSEFESKNQDPQDPQDPKDDRELHPVERFLLSRYFPDVLLLLLMVTPSELVTIFWVWFLFAQAVMYMSGEWETKETRGDLIRHFLLMFLLCVVRCGGFGLYHFSEIVWVG